MKTLRKWRAQEIFWFWLSCDWNETNFLLMIRAVMNRTLHCSRNSPGGMAYLQIFSSVDIFAWVVDTSFLSTGHFAAGYKHKKITIKCGKFLNELRNRFVEAKIVSTALFSALQIEGKKKKRSRENYWLLSVLVWKVDANSIYSF